MAKIERRATHSATGTARTARNRKSPAPPHAGIDLTSAAPSVTPAMPHERDEAVGMTGGVQSGVVQQGARDLLRGVQDTSRAPEADRAYKKLKK